MSKTEETAYAIPVAPKGKEMGFGLGLVSEDDVKAAREAQAAELKEVAGKATLDEDGAADIEAVARVRNRATAKEAKDAAKTDGGTK